MVMGVVITPLFSGHVKVSNLTPEKRSPYWMGSGEGRGGDRRDGPARMKKRSA